MKKCPICGSTRITESSTGRACKRCGWIHKKTKEEKRKK
jgi:transcription initiation factor TFIIIB Brf1 subunit/transcription initiation factor TFIIB